jgi:hypothetical protein
MAIAVDQATQRAIQAEFVPFGTIWVKFGEIHTCGGAPFGSRVVVDVVDIRISGDRLNARMKGTAAADWGSLSADGAFGLDVRFTVETDDGALIFVQYHGRCDLSGGIENPGPVYAAPRFETGDPRYSWLNTLQAIQKGKVDFARNELIYQVYEIR